MRLIALLVALAPSLAAADPFDAMPKSAAALATQATGAIDGSDEDAVLALLPKDASGALKHEIDDAGSLAAWRGTVSAWTATQDARSWDLDDDTIRVVLTPGKKGWVVVSIAKKAASAPAPTVEIAKLSLSGGSSPALVEDVLRAGLAKLAACNAPPRNGTMKVRFTIETSGAVTHATARGVGKQVAKCVAAAVRTLQFPPPDHGSTRVSAKLTFAPTGG